ncbi:GTPase HflX [Thalassoglobus sp. JC818]|uniref:GTPase HflX n=1 Tax=Thalassoglobus sp. JC818 TaxID=3232136 RepID=UPI0034587750
MGEPQRDKLKVESRKCVIVSVIDPLSDQDRDKAFDEMEGLITTAGSEVVGTLMQVRNKPDSATYIGKGKVLELKELIGATGADLIAFDAHLSPSQGKHLEEATKTQVVDRSEIILDIFATHARSHESKLQVELAQLLYLRPRLTRMWTHLERITGGIGSGKGPGEKQLETDRRLVDRRISELKRRLNEVIDRRERQVASRNRHMTVSLVGYTNAGKSTLMNALTGADVYIADKLFATLDTRTRKWTLPNYGSVLLSDTVGFIRNLPHHLVASFKSTLAEARHADLLLHVVDSSHPEAVKQIETVSQVLEEIGVDSDDPILVLNKIDAVEDRAKLDVLRARFPNSVTVSAREKTGFEKLQNAVSQRIADGFLDARVTASAGNGKVFAYLSEHAEVMNTEYEDSSVVYQCRIPRRFALGLTQAGADVMSLDGTPLTLVDEPDEW